MNVLDLLPALIASAAAIGLSPYAALATQGALAQAGLIALPTPLDGLASPMVWPALAALAVLQGGAARARPVDLVSNSLHTFISPLAAALLASAPLATPRGMGAGALTAAAFLTALMVHTYLLAVHTAAWTAGPNRTLGPLPTVQLLGAAAIGALAWLAPPYALAWAGLLVLAPLPWLPRIVGTATLPLRSLIVVLTHPTRLHRWRSGFEALPRPLQEPAREALAAAGGSLRNVRTAPVTLARWGPRWPYLHGWLVQEESLVPLFVHRRGLRARVRRLGAGPGRVDHGVLVETLEVASRVPYALCVDPGSPGAPAILAAIERANERVEPAAGGGV